MPTEAIGAFEEGAVRDSGHQREADNLFVELLHGIEIINAECDFTSPRTAFNMVVAMIDLRPTAIGRIEFSASWYSTLTPGSPKAD